LIALVNMEPPASDGIRELCSGPENYGNRSRPRGRENVTATAARAMLTYGWRAQRMEPYTGTAREAAKITAGAVAAVVMTTMLFVILFALLIA